MIDRALEYCDRRVVSFDPSKAVLVHGDAQGWNTLDAGGGTYKFVDVEGLCSEREHDLGVAMREYNEPLINGHASRLVRERAEMLAERCSVDPQAVWEWGYIERVSTGPARFATSTMTAQPHSSKSPADACEVRPAGVSSATRSNAGWVRPHPGGTRHPLRCVHRSPARSVHPVRAGLIERFPDPLSTRGHCGANQ